MRAFLISACLTFTSFISFVQSTTFYISPKGNDSNNGKSVSSPWQTVTIANQLSLQPGDRILFQAAVDHYLGGLVIGSSSVGSSSVPIIVSSYFDSGSSHQIETSNLSYARIHVDGTKNHCILVYNTAGVEISNISCFNSNPDLFSATQLGFFFYSDKSFTNSTQSPPLVRYDFIHIFNVLATGFKAGIEIGAGDCVGFSNVFIENVIMFGNWNIGIDSYGPFVNNCYSHSNIVIRNATTFNNTGSPLFPSGHTGSGIVLSSVDGGLITHSLAYGNGLHNSHAGGGPVGMFLWNSNAFVISHCVSHNNKNGFPPFAPGNADGGGFDIDGGVTNSVIEYCFSFENAGPGYLICQFPDNVRSTTNNTIRYSVSLNDGLNFEATSGALVFWTPDAINSTQIYGNTFITNGSRPVAYSPANGVTGTVAFNNAFLNVGNDSSVLDFDYSNIRNTNFSNNLYWLASSDHAVFEWNNSRIVSLDKFRQETGEELDLQGQPTGTEANPNLRSGTSFFQSCVDWDSAYPSIPNSELLNQVRNFSGCTISEQVVNTASGLVGSVSSL